VNDYVCALRGYSLPQIGSSVVPSMQHGSQVLQQLLC
jgi:hypothetical protein